MLAVWKVGKLSLKLQFSTLVLLVTLLFFFFEKRGEKRQIGVFLGSAGMLVLQCTEFDL